MKAITFPVLGKTWKAKRLGKRAFRARFGTDCVAIQDQDKRKMWFYMVDLETVVHEMVHAYLLELCLSKAGFQDVAALEEAFCELMAKHGRQLLDDSERLHALLNGGINESVAD